MKVSSLLAQILLVVSATAIPVSNLANSPDGRSGYNGIEARSANGRSGYNTDPK